MAPPPVIRLHPEDNVVIARATLVAGRTASAITSAATAAHSGGPQGRDPRRSPPANAIRRYGQIIGFASTAIAPGQHVHVHNCEMGDFAKDYAYGVDATPDRVLPAARDVPGHSPARRQASRRGTTSAS